MENIFSKVGLISVVASSVLSANSFFMNNIGHDLNSINKMMEEFANSSFVLPSGRTFRLHSTYPQMNMKEIKDNYILEFALAGMDKKDIKVTISNNNELIVEGEKKNEKKSAKDEKVYMNEIFYGKFKKMLSLPKDSDTDKLKVDFKNGILTVTIPKDKNYENKNIKVIPIR
jgi:HSP20 family protein